MINRIYTKIRENKTCFTFSYVIIMLLFIFCSNIVMHLVLSPAEEQFKEVTIDFSNGYQIAGNHYTSVSDDPQLYIKYNAESIWGLAFDFATPLSKDVSMQIYYPDENQNYTEENSAFFTLPANQNQVELEIPEGHYGVLRLDINGDFQINHISGKTHQRYYIHASLRHQVNIWFFCLMAAFLTNLFVFYLFNERLCNWFTKINIKIRSVISKKTLIQVLITIAGVACAGLISESLLSLLKNDSFNIKECYILCMVILLILSFWKKKQWYLKKMELTVAGILLLCGITFSFVMPVSLGVSWDDESHYARMISDARLNSGLKNAAEDTLIQTHVKAIFDVSEYKRDVQQKHRTEYNDVYASGQHSEEEKEPYKFQVYDLGYIPAIIGTWISWGLCLSFSGTIILTRIINVLFFAIMIYLSMKNVKSGKMLIAMFALVPTVFFLASSFSYDTWLTVLLIYGFSRYFRELQHREDPLTWGRFLGIFIPLFLALGPKVVYAPLLFLTAYMPKEKFKEKKWCYAYRACFLLAAFVMVAGLCYIASGRYNMGIGDTRGGETVNATQQLLYIKTNFSQFFSTLVSFLAGYFSYSNSATYLTFMAYMGMTTLQWIPILLLGFTAVTDRVSEDKKLVPLASKFLAVILYVVIGAICAISMYIKFTPVGLAQINGCQGRYILPAVLPVLFLISRFGGKTIVRQKVKAEYYNMALIGISVLFLMYNLWVNGAVKY